MGWQSFAAFAAESYSDARDVFDEYFNTGGYFDRIKLVTERWYWTQTEGWVPEDHC